MLEALEAGREPLILVLNKIDIAKKEDLLDFAATLSPSG